MLPRNTFTPPRAAIAIAVVAASIFVLSGCRDPRDPNVCWITGKVTFDGAPLDGDNLMVLEHTGGKFGPVAFQVKKGFFKVRVPPGEHSVTILASREVPVSPNKNGPPPPPETTPQPAMNTVQYLPDRYNKPTTLKIEVKKSGDTFTFDLDSKPDPKKPDPKK